MLKFSYIRAAKRRGVDHVLFYGLPGLGDRKDDAITENSIFEWNGWIWQIKKSISTGDWKPGRNGMAAIFKVHARAWCCLYRTHSPIEPAGGVKCHHPPIGRPCFDWYVAKGRDRFRPHVRSGFDPLPKFTRWSAKQMRAGCSPHLHLRIVLSKSRWVLYKIARVEDDHQVRSTRCSNEMIQRAPSLFKRPENS